tara:strand:- start:1243 stop:2379 length:1137 start_codon:yes stop_codon:yes gene_type:complete
MPLFEGNQQQYYGQEQFTTVASNATGGADAGQYVLTFPVNETLMNMRATMPTSAGEMRVDTIASGVTTEAVAFTFNAETYTITLGTPVAVGVVVIVNLINPQLGNYQYISMQQLINNFIVAYVGEGKLLSKCKRADISFHAQRGMQEFSYDVLRCQKSQEIELPPSLTMPLPHDYVNYVKLCYINADGIERMIHPAIKTSNPTALLQDDNFNYLYDSDGNLMEASDSDTWLNYQDNNSVGSVSRSIGDDEVDEWYATGGRYGLEPSRAHTNGTFYIDNKRGNIHFSSDLNGKTISLKYISDGLGTEEDMVVHKFAEEALYKHIAYAILCTKMGIPEYIIARFKRDRFAAVRNAKLRLSNYKMEEFAQQMRNKSKHIKH